MYDLEQIKEISVGIEDHLKRLEAFMGSMRDIKSSLDELRHSMESHYLQELQKTNRHYARISHELEKRGIPRANEYEEEFTELRTLADSEKWPAAVDDDQICTESEERKQMRAQSILDIFIGEHTKSKKFLDFGCGEGHVVMEASTREADAYGYDLKWDVIPKSDERFTSDINEVKKNGPYDIILVHDVLDHIEGEDPIHVMLQIKELLASGGRIYIRNHPWSSRHGGHLYNQHNKAFLHLIMDEVELTRYRGITCEHNIRIITPMETYRYWFESAGLKIVEETPLKQEVGEFFMKPSILNSKLLGIWKEDPIAMKNNMEIEFVEYVLEVEDVPTII